MEMNGLDIFGQVYYTLQQAMEILNVSRPTITRWLKSGKLQGTKRGRAWLFTEENLKAVLTPPEAMKDENS